MRAKGITEEREADGSEVRYPDSGSVLSNRHHPPVACCMQLGMYSVVRTCVHKIGAFKHRVEHIYFSATDSDEAA